MADCAAVNWDSVEPVAAWRVRVRRVVRVVVILMVFLNFYRFGGGLFVDVDVDAASRHFHLAGFGCGWYW